ncbi:hypothetical protein LTR53_012535 [Teratosphaeriaceae sp. CCFEE 6253]|nr:hypothetical protein LTR53_012535 [Teratosphaeriaceae sp. CCFEE 6253]
MNPVRRGETPDSEAVVSSEDERPWPSSTSFGSLPRKENGVPGLTGGIWSVSSQKRGSFKLSEAAQRNAAREARLGVAELSHSALRTANTPSPAASEGATGSLPFAIPLQPTSKAHRSLSHSQGQRETPQTSGFLPRHGSGGGALPLGLLAEDNETDGDEDSDFGGHLTHTMSHPPIGALQRASTYSAAYAHPSGLRNGSADQFEDRRLQAALSNLHLDVQPRRSQWESHLGWTDLPRTNESRRHSFADIPTRRGSFSDEGHPGISRPPVDGGRHRLDRYPSVPSTLQHDDRVVSVDDPSGGSFRIPDMYKVPFVEIKMDELTADDLRRARQQGASAYGFAGSMSRPKKLLYVVSFKCSRVLVFYLLEGTGLEIREGDIVIVEADRGQDLGTVQHADVTPDQARLYLRKYAEEQYKWLMMFSHNNAPSNINPNAQLYGESSATGASRGLMQGAPPTMQGMPRENFNNLKPKAIKRLANAHEIKMLAEKEGNEAKAKRTCQQKVAHLHLQMEILDAEWQWDFQKLIFYYYADHYINFKDLITELYRIYKTRIWLSAVNPASFSQHAMGQPPSGIGPGAITPFNGNASTSYTMAYGADPDPYGAVPPYRVGYDTYDPNYPSIPGVPNSFAPGANSNGFTPTAATFQPATNANDAAPTMHPGATSTGSTSDYNYFYERAGHPEHHMSQLALAAPPMPLPAAGLPANPYGGTPQWANQFNPYPPPLPKDLPINRSNLRAYPPSPWNNSGAPINPAAAGLGRQADIPAPIGTRPKSHGQGFAAQQQPGAGVFGNDANSSQFDYLRQYQASGQTAAYENQLRSQPGFLSPPWNGNAEMGWGRGSTAGAAGQTGQPARRASDMSAWRSPHAAAATEGAGRGSGYADEMSRER